MSIFDNVGRASGSPECGTGRAPRGRGAALHHAALWDEVKDELGKSARDSPATAAATLHRPALAVEPEVL